MSTPSTSREAELERLVHRALREQPLRRAPASLQARVLGVIESRAAVPWYRTRLSHWPLAARLGFVASCLGAVALAHSLLGMLSNLRSAQRLSAALADFFATMHALVGASPALPHLGGELTRFVPRDWLYGGLVLAACMYVLLFALIAAAYRTLYASSPITRESRP
ncbi:MAG TPA: hypothetical protein VMG11_06455 [Steroidobacteraceae bacterium]|nr:hypothetical protein [Steroidobacteraceae bacterium]